MSKSIHSAFRFPNEKEVLGQVFTPESTTDIMVKRLLEKRKNQTITIIDPCVGPGTFLNAATRKSLISQNDEVIAFDIDKIMVDETIKTYCFNNLTIHSGDYLENFNLFDAADYIVMNPPYVRQEWIKKKIQYRKAFKERYELNIPGTSNLYIYFLVKAIHDLRAGGEFSCIIYDSWQSTLYGRWLQEFLFQTCSNIDIEILHNQPFKGNLIDATILFGKKKDVDSFDNSNKRVYKTESKSYLQGLLGFEKLSNLFSTKRGLRLKQADFFLCDFEQRGSTRFVKKINNVFGYQVQDDHSEAALLINDSAISEDNQVYKELVNRIKRALKDPQYNIPILRWYHEQPKKWYVHAIPPKAPLLFNYYLRNRPKHIYNPNLPYSDNFYGLNCLNEIPEYAWLAVLNSSIVCIELLSHARNQGAGLAKLQLFEYRKSLVPDLRSFDKKDIELLRHLGARLLEPSNCPKQIIKEIDKCLYSVFGYDILKCHLLKELYDEVSSKAKKPKQLQR